MNSIVRELQKEALDSNVKITDLLRKALVCARKLKLTEFEAWINKELHGYENKEEIPEYRLIRGEIKAFNPFRGYIPVMFGDPSIERKINKTKNGQAISELENMMGHFQEPKAMLQIPFPAELQAMLMKMGGQDFPTSLFFPASVLARIIDAVRTIILNWSLKLEEEGILGEDFSFSPQEQQKAGDSKNINNFYGPVNQSQIQQGGSDSILIGAGGNIDIGKVKDFIKDLRGKEKNLKLEAETRIELEAEIRTIESQIGSPKPKQSIIKEGLESIRRILEGAAGSIAAELVLRLSGLK